MRGPPPVPAPGSRFPYVPRGSGTAQEQYVLVAPRDPERPTLGRMTSTGPADESERTGTSGSLLAYADMITLLVAFVVVLVASWLRH